MRYVIGGIIIILIVFLIGYFLRRKYYTEIDRLESWKVDIMNRPVLGELSRVKQLNMTGQTEQSFEKWRQGWDEIVAVHLPNVEELLFDAEEYTDKFRIGKSKEVFRKIEDTLETTENQIETILAELDELVGSEEKNRLEVERLREDYRNSKKQLLAHRHTYGLTAISLEKQLDLFSAKLDDYQEMTEQGNYLDAREVVLSLTDEMNQLMYKMAAIPDLLTDFLTLIPSQIDELESGYTEMQKQGYILEHLEFEEQVKEIRKVLNDNVTALEQLEIERVEEQSKEMKENIEVLYDLFEKEVHAKEFVLKHKEDTIENLEKVKEENYSIREDIGFIQEGYQLLEDEIEAPSQLEKKLQQLTKRYELVLKEEEENLAAYSYLQEELTEILKQIEEIKEEQIEFHLFLQNLRRDEIAARETVAELKKNIMESNRKIQKSNIPGLPTDYMELLDQANKNIQHIILRLEEKPLNMKAVQEQLSITEEAVNLFSEKTEELLENVILVEKVIQYGNRYRSRYASVNESLMQAESAFRSFDYQNALEQAAAAVEQVEPGALKKIERLLNEEY